MTKKLFAMVLAAVLALTMFVLPASADGTATLNLNTSTKTLTLSWEPVTGATYYQVVFFKDGSQAYQTAVTVTSTTNTNDKCTASYTATVGGNYTAEVTAKTSASGSTVSVLKSNSQFISTTVTGTNGFTATGNSSTSTTLSWNAQAGFTTYYVEYTYSNNGQNASGTVDSVSTNSTTISVALSNLLSVKVYGGTKSNHTASPFISWTNTGSGSTGGSIGGTNISYTRNGNYVHFTWAASLGATRLGISTSSSYSNASWVSVSGLTQYTATLPSGMTYYVFLANSTQVIGSVMVSPYGSGSATSNMIASRPYSTASTVTLSWQGTSSMGYYTIRYYNTLGQSNTITTTGTRYSLNLDYTQSWTFEVMYYGSTTVFARAYLAAYATSSSSGSTSGPVGTGTLNITRGTTNATVTWQPVSGATYYVVTHSKSNGSSSTVNITYPYISLNYASTDTWQVSVQAYSYNGPIGYVGGAVVTPSTITQTGGGGSSIGTSGTNVTSGYNCMVTSYDSYAVIRWNSSGSYLYNIQYTVDGSTFNYTAQATTATLNIPITKSYYVRVIDMTNNLVAYANVPGRASSSGSSSTITKTEVENLTYSYKNATTTTISWQKAPDAYGYMIWYGPLGAETSFEDMVIGTTYDVPMGLGRDFQVTVIAITNSNRMYEIGHLYNVAGSTPDTDSGSSSDNRYPTNFKAVSGNKKVTLSWDKADNADYYTLYYRRATSSKWLKVNQRLTKSAVNVNGLTNGVEYEFKIVTDGGYESGVLKIAPSTTSTTVRAPDPVGSDSDVSLDENYASLTSVTSTQRGQVVVSWNNIGAPGYRIYIAEGTSSTYKYCGTYDGTRATLTRFGNGSSAKSFTSGQTYKVRIVRSDYKSYGTLSECLSACAPLTVTVR